MNPINKILSNVDTYVSQKNQKQSAKEGNVTNIAENIISDINKLHGNRKYLNTEQMVFFGAILFKLHNLQEPNKNDQEVKRLYSTIFNIIGGDSRFEAENLKLAPAVFENMLSLVETDVTEEVIGQERPPGGLVNQVAAEILKDASSPFEESENKEKIKKLADKLYTFVILSASMHPGAPVPSKANEVMALFQDVETFKKECGSQFGLSEERNRMLEHNDFFMDCLKTAWHYKRTNQL